MGTLSNKIIPSNVRGILKINNASSINLSIAQAFSGQEGGYYMLIGESDYKYIHGFGYFDGTNAVGNLIGAVNYQGTPIAENYVFAGTLTDIKVIGKDI